MPGTWKETVTKIKNYDRVVLSTPEGGWGVTTKKTPIKIASKL